MKGVIIIGLKIEEINNELVIVNDGSTDNSLKIINSFGKKDKRISIINQKNQGVSNSRNTGLKVQGTFFWKKRCIKIRGLQAICFNSSVQWVFQEQTCFILQVVGR